MSKKTLKRTVMRKQRHLRVRKKINGTTERPRLCVFRSAKHIYAQVVDDGSGATLVSASTLSPDVKDKLGDEMDKSAQSKVVGQVIGQKARDQGINTLAFDRGGYLYHGRVKALADGARESGLTF
ncbi:MAG: 50S ribosomal protein L18 [Candidatus Latescibacteria bacterium]|jgi:large subunit ribosomal protein L18|nr:50S ribosomal protein L18 [Candidatus Latescibacterota bacterium]